MAQGRDWRGRFAGAGGGGGRSGRGSGKRAGAPRVMRAGARQKSNVKTRFIPKKGTHGTRPQGKANKTYSTMIRSPQVAVRHRPARLPGQKGLTHKGVVISATGYRNGVKTMRQPVNVQRVGATYVVTARH